MRRNGLVQIAFRTHAQLRMILRRWRFKEMWETGKLAKFEVLGLTVNFCVAEKRIFVLVLKELP